jgi:hypothetical protein
MARFPLGRPKEKFNDRDHATLPDTRHHGRAVRSICFRPDRHGQRHSDCRSVPAWRSGAGHYHRHREQARRADPFGAPPQYQDILPLRPWLRGRDWLSALSQTALSRAEGLGIIKRAIGGGRTLTSSYLLV